MATQRLGAGFVPRSLRRDCTIYHYYKLPLLQLTGSPAKWKPGGWEVKGIFLGSTTYEMLDLEQATPVAWSRVFICKLKMTVTGQDVVRDSEQSNIYNKASTERYFKSCSLPGFARAIRNYEDSILYSYLTHNKGGIIHSEIRLYFSSWCNQSSITFNKYDLVQTGVRVTLVLHNLIDLEGCITAFILSLSFSQCQRDLHGRFQFS